MENKERVVIEPEVVGSNDSKKNNIKDGKFNSFDDMSDFAKDFAEGELRGIKNKILIQGFLYLFVIGIVLILIIWAIAKLLAFILPPVFVAFITIGIVLVIGYPIYWLVRKFRK